MKKHFLTLCMLVLSLIMASPMTHAESQLETTIAVYNETQNADGAKVVAKPGDILTYTMTLKNLGPDDLVDYSPLVNIEDLLPFADILDYGNGGIYTDEIFIEYPPVLQTANCGCEDTFTFTVQIKANVCIDNMIIERAFPIVVFEDSGVGINIGCEPKPTPEAPVETPKSGPEVLLIGLLAVIGAAGTRFVAIRS